jgi:cell division protease FtsH
MAGTDRSETLSERKNEHPIPLSDDLPESNLPGLDYGPDNNPDGRQDTPVGTAL